MDKQEKIKEAYLGLGLPFSENILFDNGWLKIKPTQYQSKYQYVDLLKLTNHVHSIRPKSLQGIENNNGWIKIESEDDLPKKSGLYFITRRKTNSIELVEIKLYVKSNIKFSVRNYSHYQPIEKPKLPIY